MKRILSTLVMVLLMCVGALCTTVTSTTKIIGPDGQPFNGTITLQLPFAGVNSVTNQLVLATPVTANIFNGVITPSIAVTGNDVMSPAMPYSALYMDLSGNPVTRQLYYITGTTFDVGSAPATPNFLNTNVLAGTTLTITGNALVGGNLVVTGISTLSNINNHIYVDGTKYPSTAAGIQSAINDAISNQTYEVNLPCGDVSISSTLNIINGPMSFKGCSGGDVTNSGSSGVTRLKYTGAAGSDLLNIDGGASRLAGIRLYNILLDGNGLARYSCRFAAQDVTYLENVKCRSGVTANAYIVNTTGMTAVNSQFTCLQTGGAGLVIDWGSSNFNFDGTSWDTGGCNINPGVELWIGGGAVRSIFFNGQSQFNINVSTAIGFGLITGYDTTVSPWPSAGTAIAGAPDTVIFNNVDVLYGANNPAPVSQGSDFLVNGTATNLPKNIYFNGFKFDARLASGGGQVAVKSDNALNVNLMNGISQGHTAGAACTFNVTSNTFSPGGMLFNVNSTNTTGTDTNRTCGTVTSIADCRHVLNSFNCNGPLSASGVTLGGETFTTSPRTVYSAFYSGTLSATGTFARIILDKAITVTRVNVAFFANGTTCTVFPKIRVSDGSSNVDTTATTTAFADSGAVSQNYAAGANIDISLNAAQACTVGNFQNAMVEVQYKTQ